MSTSELNPGTALESITRRKLLDNCKSVVAAVSGGCDSSVMLDILAKLSTRLGFKLSVCHVNHNLRGEESLRDENFVRGLCKQYGVGCEVLSADVKGFAAENGLSTEEAGRKIRYGFFAECAEKQGEGTLIATAHSLSDRTETFLFNSARGAGVPGLCSIPPKRDNIIRPLIDFTRAEIEAYAKQNSLTFVTDSTNLEDIYSRNKIRHNAVPVLEELNPAFEHNMASLFDDLGEIRDYIDSEAKALLLKSKSEKGFSAKTLAKASPAIRKAAAAKILEHFGFTAERSRILFLSENLGKSFRNEYAKGRYLVFDGTEIFADAEKEKSPPIDEIPFAEGCFPLNGEKTAEISLLSPEKFNCSYKIKGYVSKDAFDYDKIIGVATIRSRREGDKANLHGGTKTLKKLFNEEKIPPEKRDSVAVISDGKGVVWVEGLGAEKRCRVTDSTKTVAAVKIRKIQPSEP